MKGELNSPRGRGGAGLELIDAAHLDDDGNEEGHKNTMMCISDLNLVGPVQLPMPSHELVGLETWLTTLIWDAWSEEVEHFLKLIQIDVENKSLQPVASVLPEDMHLIFAGRVSHQQVKVCLKVCTIKGIDFFVHGSEHNSINSMCIVPAWTVPCAKPSNKTASLTKESAAGGESLEMKYVVGEFLWDPSTLTCTRSVDGVSPIEGTVKFDLSIPCLVPHANYVGKSDVTLMRILSREEVEQQKVMKSCVSEGWMCPSSTANENMQEKKSPSALPKEKKLPTSGPDVRHILS